MARFRLIRDVPYVVVGGLLLAACAPPASDDEPGSGQGQAATDAPGTEQPEETGGRLVVARTGDIDNLDPHLATRSRPTRPSSWSTTPCSSSRPTCR